MKYNRADNAVYNSLWNLQIEIHKKIGLVFGVGLGYKVQRTSLFNQTLSVISARPSLSSDCRSLSDAASFSLSILHCHFASISLLATISFESRSPARVHT